MSETMPLTGYWSEGVSMPKIAQNCTAAACGGSVYAIGGYDGTSTDRHKDYLQRFDIESQSWSAGVPMPTPRYFLSAVVAGGKIYCAGGVQYNPSNRSSYLVASFEAYDTRDMSWARLHSLPITVSDGACAAKDGKIYYIGGNVKSATSKTLFIYDIEQNEWEQGNAPPYGPAYAAAVVVGNEIYVAGSAQDSMLIYNIPSGEWRRGAAKPFAGRVYQAVKRDGYLYFFTTSLQMTLPAIYNIEADEWSVGVPTPFGEQDYSACAVEGNQAYAVGALQPRTRVYTFGDLAVTHYFTWEGNFGAIAQISPEVIPVERGGRYSVSVPHLPGYEIVGYRIDNKTQVNGLTATIEDIQADHAIMFVYRQSTVQVDHHTITEQYRDTGGEALRPDVARLVQKNGNYRGTAPAIAGYKYVGYRVDGVLLPERTAGVSNVITDKTITFVYEQDEGTAPPPELTLTEEFIGSDGTRILPDNVMHPQPGDDYQNTAPRLDGYKRVGHKIDGGEAQATRTARLNDIRQSHTVTFLYEPCDGEACIDYEHVITESYWDAENGTHIRPDTATYLDTGEDYRKTAPRLEGYNRTGHRIDDGEAVTTRTAVLENVQQNHHVTFLYEPCDGERCIDYPGGPGDGENPGPGGCECGQGHECGCSECHCVHCTCEKCTHGGDPGDGGGDPGDGGGDPGNGDGKPGGNQKGCGCNPCWLPMMPCVPVMPVMMMPMMVMPCMPAMNWGCGCGGTAVTPAPQPGDEDDVDDCNDPK